MIGEKKEKRVKGEERKWKVGFWNVAGIMNKGDKFWREIKQWKIVVMVGR